MAPSGEATPRDDGVWMNRTATMEWDEASAEAMLQPRCLWALGHWEEFWGPDQFWQIIHARAA